MAHLNTLSRASLGRLEQGACPTLARASLGRLLEEAEDAAIQPAGSYDVYSRYREKRRQFLKLRRQVELEELERQIQEELRGKKKRIKKRAKKAGKPFKLPEVAKPQDVETIKLKPLSEPISAAERGLEFDVRSYEILLAELEEVRERIEEEEAMQAIIIQYAARY